MCTKLLVFLLILQLNKPPATERLKVETQALGQSITLMEGGNFSIDIRRDPIPLKSHAMQDYLMHEIPEISACQGVYFGNQNQFFSDRVRSRYH